MLVTGSRWVLLATVFIGLSHASPRPIPAGHVVHEERNPSQQSSWVKRSRIDGASMIPVRIGLVQSNLEEGRDLLTTLSHPDSPKYGQWWSAEDVRDFFAPTAETVDKVKSWVKSTADIADERIVHSDNKGWLAVDATVKEAELLFKTTFHEYQHSKLDEMRIGTDSYHIPDRLTQHIDYVVPAVKMSRVRKRTIKRDRTANPASRSLSRRAYLGSVDSDEPASSSPDDDDAPNVPGLDPALEDCDRKMRVACLRALYGFPANPQAVEGNSVGVFEMGDYFDQDDLDRYYTDFASWVANGTAPIPAAIDGAQYNTTQNASNIVGEAIADISVTQAIVYPQNVTLYQVDDPPQAHNQVYRLDDKVIGFNTFLDSLDGSYCTYSAYNQTGNDPKYDAEYPNPDPNDPNGYQGQLMCGTYTPTKVITISWAAGENDLPPNYQKRECDEFLKLGLQGVSILVATGDDGVASFGWDPDPNGCIGHRRETFHPLHPATCPYVTAVGATRIWHNQTVLDAESVMYANIPSIDPTKFPPSNVTSGGGFSPDYQKAAVQNYFDNYDPGYPYYAVLEPDFRTIRGRYNRIGRGLPDISVNGVNYGMYIAGHFTYYTGTSVSAPALAGILTLLNQERALIGKDSIGFINPVIYARPEVLNDIVNGTNVGCGTNGFPAVPGWDPSTGGGTPNYPKMLDLWLSLP